MSSGRQTERSDDGEIDFTITTPAEAADEYDVRYFRPDGRHYTRVSPNGSDETELTYAHHLDALLNHDPHRVFAEGTEIHHDSFAFLNLPEYVDVVERDHHHRLHRCEAFALNDEAIPVRREAGEVPDEERVEIGEPDRETVERFALPPRADSPIHGDDETEGGDE
jgi:hypothetical protein